MTPTLVNEEALDRFIQSADLTQARRCEVALIAMAAAVRMRVVELETRHSAAELAAAGRPEEVPDGE